MNEGVVLSFVEKHLPETVSPAKRKFESVGRNISESTLHNPTHCSWHNCHSRGGNDQTRIWGQSRDVSFRSVSPNVLQEHQDINFRSVSPNVLRDRFRSDNVSFRSVSPGTTLAAWWNPTAPDATGTWYLDIENKPDQARMRKNNGPALPSLHTHIHTQVEARTLQSPRCVPGEWDGGEFRN